MPDYFKTYCNFIRAKQVHGISFNKNKKKKFGYERHHIVPKCMGNPNVRGEILLSEFDHCLAHVLLNLALIQKGEKPISYAIRPCLTYGDHHLVRYWNPLSKLKVIGHNEKADTDVMTVLDAAKFIAKLNHIHILKKNKTKNGFVKAVLRSVIDDIKVNGYHWKIAN